MTAATAQASERGTSTPRQQHAAAYAAPAVSVDAQSHLPARRQCLARDRSPMRSCVHLLLMRHHAPAHAPARFHCGCLSAPRHPMGRSQRTASCTLHLGEHAHPSLGRPNHLNACWIKLQSCCTLHHTDANLPLCFLVATQLLHRALSRANAVDLHAACVRQTWWHARSVFHARPL